MKDKLTCGMPENLEVIVFACFGIWGFFKKIIKVEFSGTALKYLLRPFSTLHILISCPVELFSLIMSPDVSVQIRLSHFFV